MRALFIIILFTFNIYLSNAQTIPVFIPDKKEIVKPNEVVPARKVVTPKKTKQEITNGFTEKNYKITSLINGKFSADYYSGPVKNGKANGYGKLYDRKYWSGYGWREMLKFEGEFVNNEPVYGIKYTVGSNDEPCKYFEGEFANGFENGKGIKYICGTNRIYYEGVFKEGRFLSGKTYMSNGDIFEGLGVFLESTQTGKYTFVNGDIYEGEFKDCKMHGQGKYTWKNGVNYTGEFSNNTIIGQGTLVFSDNTYNNKYFVTSETRNICLYSNESNNVIKCWETYKINATKGL